MKKHGLTLLEVIVASLVLAITVGGVLYIFSTEKGIVARTGRQVVAMDFTCQQLEDLKNAVTAGGADAWPGGTLDETDSAWGDPGTWNAWEDLSGEFAWAGKFGGQGRRYRVQNIDADGAGEPVDYKQVQVVVDWDEPAEPE